LNIRSPRFSPKKRLAACFHRPPGNYNLIEERYAEGITFIRRVRMGLFIFTMMMETE